VEMSKASEEIEEARKRLKAAQEKYENIKKTSEIAKKRIIFLVSDSLNTELGEVKPSCSICFEKYEDPKRQETSLPCGHKFCYPCVTHFYGYTCPKCRQVFDWDKIIKNFQD